MNRPFCYDDAGNPVVQGNGYLGDLWKNLAKCGLEHHTEKTGFDPKKFYDSIAAALGNVDALLQVFQETKKSDGMVSLVSGTPDSKPLILAHDRKRLYLEAAKRLKMQADQLSANLQRFESFLQNCVTPLINLGFQVDYLEADDIWIVDYGYKQMFAHFEVHFDSVVSRGHYAVIKDDTGRLVYKFCQSPEYRLICTVDGGNYGLSELFGVDGLEEEEDDDNDNNNNQLMELLKLLGRKRQSLLEKDLYDYILKKELFPEASIKLVERDDVLYDSTPTSQQLLIILRDYLVNK